MKVQTTALLLCFLSGVFLSAVVHAKPSPALMKELIALEKYLEKKQGSDSADGQNKNQGEKQISDNGLEGLFNEQMEPTNNGQDKPKIENNVGGDESNGVVPPEKPDEGVPPKQPDEGVPPKQPEDGGPLKKPEDGVAPEKPEETDTSENTQEGLAPSDGEDGEKNPEDNEPNKSEGQVEGGRDQIFTDFNQLIETLKAVVDKLQTLSDEFRKQLKKDDRKLEEIEENDKQTKEKAKEKLGKLKTILEEIGDTFGMNTPEKKSVKENAPARRNHLSDTEFLNIVHSLLTNN